MIVDSHVGWKISGGTLYSRRVTVCVLCFFSRLQAKQRASVQWLLSKAYGHQVPDDLREPFYRDAANQDYLKPSIVHSLANADLYCRALAHIYADPNYSQLNHWGVIQALNRKGVYVAEPSDVTLTETTLIHTSPLRLVREMFARSFYERLNDCFC